jgi:hypothetical protein
MLEFDVEVAVAYCACRHCDARLWGLLLGRCKPPGKPRDDRGDDDGDDKHQHHRYHRRNGIFSYMLFLHSSNSIHFS